MSEISKLINFPKADGSSIRLFHFNPGPYPAIVCLHGFSGSGLDFELLASRLTKRFQLICPNWPGHCGDEQLGKHASSQSLRLAKETIEYAFAFARIQGELAGIIAYSMGSRLLVQTLDSLPLQNFPTILISGSTGLIEPESRRQRLKADTRLSQFILEEGIEAFADQWEAIPLISPQTQISEPYATRLAQRRRNNSPEGLAQSLVAYSPGTLPAIPNALDSMRRLILIVGETDQKYRKIAHGIAYRNPQARIHTILKAHHAPHLEAPQTTADTIIKELRETEATRA